MAKRNTDDLRTRALSYRTRADTGVYSATISEAFYQMANALEARALVQDAAVLDAANWRRT
jgi:predicted kinase